MGYESVDKLQNLLADKKGNVFTKVRMDCDSDRALCDYFSANLHEIEGWFNVISPQKKSLADLKRELLALSKKNWEAVYGNC